MLEAVAAGDLTQSLDIATKDEIGQMAGAANKAVASMREAMSEVRTSSDGVASAAEQLASASEELSSGAQEQASSQEETSATLEEITTTVKQSAENARQANQLAAGARETAEKGGDVVTSAVAAMGEINSASKRIADIITDDRRDRVPDQPAGAQCSRRSGARGRTGPRLCRGRLRGPQPGAAQRHCRQGDQGADPGFRAEGRQRI